MRFFLEETLVKKTLSSVKRSVLDYFLFAVLDKEKRQELVRFAYLHFEPKDKFVWCPRKIQKLFRKTEKRSDAVGNGDGRDEVCSRGKSKEGDAVVPQKEDGFDKVTKDQRGTNKTASKDKDKSSESSPEPKPKAETVGNGNAEVESSYEILGNGNDSADDVDEMDQSPSPDTVTAKTEPCADGELKLTNNSKAGIQEPDSMQTDGDLDTEKPPKKKREDNKELPSNGSAGELASGPTEEKAGANKAAGQTSSSAQTPPKTSKHSPSPFLGREEKIPRTDFNQVPDKKEDKETSQANVAPTNGSLTSKDKGVNEQMNGKDSEDINMELHTLSSDQNVGNS